MVDEPILAVRKEFLDFGKMQRQLPVVVSLYEKPAFGPGRKPSPAETGLRYIQSVNELYFLPGPIMADCDYDALWVDGTKKTTEFALNSLDVKHAPRFLERICCKDDLGRLNWGEGGISADEQRLLTTVVADENGCILGVAYSSQQSARENFIPKTIVMLDEEIGPVNVFTLCSRSRGLWPKGLKNPNENKDAPLPKRLELSSGNYLVFQDMCTTQYRDALLIQVDVPEGHSFCHHGYIRGPKFVALHSTDRDVLEGTVPYRSCFHYAVFTGFPFDRFKPQPAK